jgi:hypothetical protein
MKKELTHKKTNNSNIKNFINGKKMRFFRLIEKTEDVIIRMSAK